MRDTDPEFQKMYEAHLMALTPEERLVMCCSMFETAQKLAEASFPPGIDERTRRRLLVERFYGKELAAKVYPT
jgi:hypothetical protein